MIAYLQVSDIGIGNALIGLTSKHNKESNKIEVVMLLFKSIAIVASISLILYIVISFFIDGINWQKVLNFSDPSNEMAIEAVKSYLLMFCIGLPLALIQQVRLGSLEGHINSIYSTLGFLLNLALIYIGIKNNLGIPNLIIMSMLGTIIFNFINMIEFVTKILRDKKNYFSKKKNLSIFEEGVGHGQFVAELKNYFQKEGKNTHITALSKANLPKLTILKQKQIINDLLIQSAELFRPKRFFDLIVSLFGPTNYTLPIVRKQHLQKLAHSLSKNGILLLGFEFKKLNSAVNYGLFKSLGEKDKTSSSKSNFSLEAKNIVRAFEKQGFRARFFNTPINLLSAVAYPKTILIVQRIR